MKLKQIIIRCFTIAF